MLTDENLLEALKRTRKERIRPYVGICINVMHYLVDMDCDRYGYSARLQELFADWPLHSGFVAFPVPYRRRPAQAYNRLQLWSRRTKYGRARFALLDYAIAKLEAKIAANV